MTLAKRPPMDELQALKLVEQSPFGTLEALAFHVMVEEPDLLEADPTIQSEKLGLPLRCVQYLFTSSKQFLALLDWQIAREAYSFRDRRTIYGRLRERVLSGEEKLADTVRTVEYLDRKTGTPAVADNAPPPQQQIQIAIVHEGGGPVRSEYRALEFGQAPTVARLGPVAAASTDGSDTVVVAEEEDNA